jgi:GNAT superfamily N-acetyltransferase
MSADPRAQIEPLREADIPALIQLARDIWYHHYPSIISVDQIEYMLAQRYSPELIRTELAAKGVWWDVLRINGALAAFASCELGARAGEMKLDKLYVRNDLQGRGYGSLLIAHVANRAREEACSKLYLQVNRNNSSAIRAYEHNGFEIREAAKFDIGGGFVMDDYVMVKTI